MTPLRDIELVTDLKTLNFNMGFASYKTNEENYCYSP